MNNAVLAVWMQSACGIGSPLVPKLLYQYGGIEQVYNEKEYAGFDTTKAVFDKLCNKDLGAAEHIVRLCNARHIQIVTCEDRDFPKSLVGLRKMPVLLYCVGNVKLLFRTCAAIVGSRGASDFGQRSAYKLAKAFSEKGITVVSGMARGIDAAAHYGALEGKGSTIAVLGTAIDHPYPQENIPLYDRIVKNGLVVSEIGPSQQVSKWNFAERNRLISGLADLICIGEAREGSGALITAKCADTEGKQTVVLPLLPYESYAGSIKLAEQGVPVLTTINDALYRFMRIKHPPEEMFDEYTKTKAYKARSNDLSEAIIELVEQREGLSVNQIIGILGVDSAKVMAEVTLLELSGRLYRLPGDRYKINK